MIGILFSSCQNYKEELKHLGELQTRLEANRSNFDLDIPLFKTRTVYVQNTLRSFTNDYKDTMSIELGNALSRYKAIKKIYDRHTSNYEQNQKEQADLEKQLNDLEADLNSGKLSREEFKAYYNIEKIDIEALIKSSSATRKILYEVEPDYMRITKELNPILETI